MPFSLYAAIVCTVCRCRCRQIIFHVTRVCRVSAAAGYAEPFDTLLFARLPRRRRVPPLLPVTHCRHAIRLPPMPLRAAFATPPLPLPHCAFCFRAAISPRVAAASAARCLPFFAAAAALTVSLRCRLPDTPAAFSSQRFCSFSRHAAAAGDSPPPPFSPIRHAAPRITPIQLFIFSLPCASFAAVFCCRRFRDIASQPRHSLRRMPPFAAPVRFFADAFRRFYRHAAERFR